ncbi:MAG: hypothetical protein FWE85_00735 [Clostridiales bacterium]|nr:hypothetical protein [Clostridiales bacterium]
MKKPLTGVPAQTRTRPFVKWRFAAFLAVFVLAALVASPGFLRPAKGAAPPRGPWADQYIFEQYPEMTLNNKQYKLTTEVDSSEIGEFVCSATAFGYDDDGIRREKGCSVSLIESLSNDYALAVKYEGHDGYFIFADKLYAPATLGDFINDTNLLYNLVFDQKGNRIEYLRLESGKSSITYKFPEADDITSAISELLLSNISATAASPENRLKYDYMCAFVYLDVIGNGIHGWAIYPDGYIVIKIPECSAGFYIGEEEAQAFIEYVQANGVKDRQVNKTVLIIAIAAFVIMAAVFIRSSAREARAKTADKP